MRELRQDPLLGRWVLFATDRSRRPSDYRREPPRFVGGDCPFCPGAEAETPPEVFGAREGPGGDWRLRVVPNRYPALSHEEEGTESGRDDLLHRLPGYGAHEVVIECAEHDRTLADLSDDAAARVFVAIQGRLRHHRGDARIAYVQSFKNHGPAAGATLAHPHSQLVALPIVPRRIADELDGARAWHDRTGRCLFCDLVTREDSVSPRFVAGNEGAVAFCPWAARRPYEIWLLPRAHEARFEEASGPSIAATASLLCRTLRALDALLARPAYNLILDTAPFRVDASATYHWRFELLPALSHLAGFEWGTGLYINSVPPEDAAARLRGALP